jgi:hypothetical protein
MRFHLIYSGRLDELALQTAVRKVIASTARYEAAKLPRFAVVVGLPVLALVTVVLFGEPLFETNDDCGLAMTAAGFGSAVAPEPHLIFSHFGYGLLLKIVSRFAGPNAHGWTSLAALGLSMALYTRALIGYWPQKNVLIGAALVVAFGCIFARALLDPQFTITAALLFGAAAGCRMAVLPDKTRSVGLSTSVYGAIILSFLIRPTVAILGFVVVSPALIWLAWRGPESGRRPALHFLTALVAITAVIFLTDKAGYAFSPDWRDAVEYNQLRSLFNDFYRIPWIPGAPEYAKVGWSANDHAMFMNWYSLHPIFDYPNIKYLADTLLLQAPLFALSDTWAWVTSLWHSPLLSAMIVVQVLLCILLPHHRTFLLLVMIGTFVALVASGLTGRPPVFRVQFSAISLALLCTLPLLLNAVLPTNLVGRAAICLLLGTGLYGGTVALQLHEERVFAAAAYRTKLLEAKSYFSGTVIIWGATLAWEWLITPTKVYPPITGSTIPSIGLFIKTPVMRAALQRLGITDLGSTLCTQADVRLVAAASNVATLQNFCQEHYQVRPTYSLVFSYAPTELYLSGNPNVGSKQK